MVSRKFPIKQVSQNGTVVIPKDMKANPIQRVFGYSVK